MNSTGSNAARPLRRADITAADEARFWRGVDRSGEGCWLWRRAPGTPYGRFYVRESGRQHGVHRVSAALAYGDIDAGRVVLHLCDTPRCVRPDHLRLGTQQENVRDMLEKGRDNPTTPRGSFHGDQRKLSSRTCTCGHPEHEHVPVGVDFRAFYGCVQRITSERCQCRYFMIEATPLEAAA